MKKSMYLIMLGALFIVSCKKEQSRTIDQKDESQVSFDIDGEIVEIIYSGEETNECSTAILLVGMLVIILEYDLFFELSNKVNMQISFGTSIEPEYKTYRE